MIKMNMLIQLIINRIRSKRRFKNIIFTIFFLYLFYKIFKNDSDENKIRFRYDISVENDSYIDTKFYSLRYQEYLYKKRLQKKQYDFNFRNIKEIIPKARQMHNNDNYLIVEYTKIFGQTKFCHRFNDSKSNSYLYVNECPYKNCQFSCDINDIQAADALLFHEADIYSEALIDPNFIQNAADLHTKNPDMLFMLWNDEANLVKEALDKIKFNWTISYRYDAEVSDCAYGCLYDKSINSNEALGKKILYVKHHEDNFNRKETSAVWFVSNCESKQRIEFALQLGKYFPLKVYGKCSYEYYFKQSIYSYFGYFGGIMFNMRYYNEKDCGHQSECENQNLNSNKFYLAFESKNCSNYITEKFWRILRYNIVPVVFQPSKQFYLKIAPPNSFIHSEDFGHDPKKLGEYLHMLSNNYEIYSEYLVWKTEYESVFSGKINEKTRFCELCTLLNTETSAIYYNSVSKWFNSDCIIN